MPDPTAVVAETVAAPATARRPRIVFAGYTAGQLLGGLGLAALIVWGMWVTRSLTAAPPQRIVKADLSRIVGDYVQAQARSATPQPQVQAQMRAFMASLDAELQRRGAGGQVVLVGEAVLSKSVPDITSDVVHAVYAAGVQRPRPAPPAQMGAMLGAAQPAPPASPAPTIAAPGQDNPFGPSTTAPAAPLNAPASPTGGSDGQ